MTRHCYLTPHQLRRLDAACAPIVAAYGPFTTYLVGSVLSRPDYRDVDVRTIIADSQFDSMFGAGNAQDDGGAHDLPLWQLVCMAISGELSRASGLNVDWQVQRRTESAHGNDGVRNPIGCRWSLTSARWDGDQ